MRNRSVNLYDRRVEHSQGRWGPAITPLLAALGPVIYAIRTRDGLIKIGFTTNLGQRYSSLGSQRDILAWRPGSYAEEQALHDQLSAHVCRGREWYHPHPEVLAVVNAMRGDLGQTPLAS